jgi:hypothetical protein
MEKTWTGSCACGAVRYEVDVDLSHGTGRCNCTWCAKTRSWGTRVKPDKFRLLDGQDAIVDYSKHEALHHPFCGRCGVRTHYWGHIPEVGGDFVTVLVSTLDAEPADLLEGPIRYFDGRNDNWWNAPNEIRHL